MNCIFCSIINKDSPAEIVYENEKVVAFKDINPKAPVHILLVTKKHIPSMQDITAKDREDLGELLLASKEVAKIHSISYGYKLVFNVGRKGGQIIDHIHLHILGGW